MTNKIKQISGLNVYEVTMINGDGVAAQGPDFLYNQREYFKHELKAFLTSTELLHQILKAVGPEDVHTERTNDELRSFGFIIDNYNLFYQLTLEKALEMVDFIFTKMDENAMHDFIMAYPPSPVHIRHHVNNLITQLELVHDTEDITNGKQKIRIASDVDIIGHMNQISAIHPDFTFVIHVMPMYTSTEPELRYFQNGEELFPNNLENKLKSMTDDEVKKTMTELAKKSYDIGLVYVFDAYNHFLNAEVSNSPEGMELLHEMELTSNELRRRKLVPTIEEINKKLSQFFKHVNRPQW